MNLDPNPKGERVQNRHAAAGFGEKCALNPSPVLASMGPHWGQPIEHTPKPESGSRTRVSTGGVGCGAYVAQAGVDA